MDAVLAAKLTRTEADGLRWVGSVELGIHREVELMLGGPTRAGLRQFLVGHVERSRAQLRAESEPLRIKREQRHAEIASGERDALTMSDTTGTINYTDPDVPARKSRRKKSK